MNATSVRVTVGFIGVSFLIWGYFMLFGNQNSADERSLSSQTFFADLRHHFQKSSSDTIPAQNALKLSCQKILSMEGENPQKLVNPKRWQSVCKKALNDLAEPVDDLTFVSWLESNFDVRTSFGGGKMTGYFQPELKASRQKTERYRYPIYKRPEDLILIEDLAQFTERARGIRIAGRLAEVERGPTTLKTLVPYDSRKQIESGSLSNQGLEIAYVDDEVDLFFMHIQGSGRLIFEDGGRMTVSYHGTNGHDYTAIGKALLEQGLIAREKISMASIKAWLRKHPGPGADIMNQNASYVFFRIQDENQVDTIGAQNAPITAMGSVATDPHYYPLGSLLWMESGHPNIGNRFVVAQDVGGAIKGKGRVDLFCGVGDNAGALAGPLNEQITLVSLFPKT